MKSKDIQIKHELPSRALNELWKVFRDFAAGASTVIGLFLTFLTLGEYVGIDLSWIKSFGRLGIYFIGIHALCGGMLYGIVMVLWRKLGEEENNRMGVENSSSTDRLSGGLVGEITELYKKEQFTETVRFGMLISRHLWLSGRYSDRVKIGYMVEEAASRLELKYEQAQTLVDDIGWTNFLIGNIQKAEKNIAYGIELATKNGFPYWAAKGERHLAGISDWFEKNQTKALLHLKKAEQYAHEINDELKQKEILAGLKYAMAELLISQDDFTSALESSTEALKLYESMMHQDDRTVKLYSQLGRVYLKSGLVKQAKDMFRKGFEDSKRLSRVDEQARNLLGLGRVSLQEKEYQKATDFLEQALPMFEEMNLVKEIQIVENVLSQVRAQQFK